MGGIKGDFEALADLKRRIESISKPSFRMQLTRGLAEEARTQVHEGFRREEDPEGVPWKPSWSPNTLRDTGRLRNSIASHAYPGGFTLSTNVKYAAVHQYGAVIRAKNARTYSFRPRKRIGRVISPGGGRRSLWEESPGRVVRSGGKPMLRWQSTTGFRIGGRGGKRLKNPQAMKGWFQKEQVTIPRRRFIPEGRMGHRWTTALGDTATRIMVRQMGGDF